MTHGVIKEHTLVTLFQAFLETVYMTLVVWGGGGALLKARFGILCRFHKFLKLRACQVSCAFVSAKLVLRQNNNFGKLP